MASNPIQDARTKDIEIDLNFVREHVNTGDLRLSYLPTEKETADIFTKSLSTSRFKTLRDNLCIISNSRASNISSLSVGKSGKALPSCLLSPSRLSLF
jgi:hypothetical protein